MQNTSLKSQRPRPLNYPHTSANLHSFVHGSPTHPQPFNLPFNMTAQSKSANHFHPTTSLFDRYNRPNLYLRDCEPKDITHLHKNIVMHEEQLSGRLIDEIATKSQKQKFIKADSPEDQSRFLGTEKLFAKTSMQPAPSREFVQNQVMFNYKEMGEIKRQQKKQYLSEIEKKIAEAERQIQDLNQLQEQQQMEMQQINRHQERIGQQLTRNVQTGIIKQKVGYLTGFEEEHKQEPIHIHQQMNPRQIAQVLDQHYKLNEDILEIAEMAQKGKRKSVEKPVSKKSKELGNTLKKSLGEQKSMYSTMKEGTKSNKMYKR